MTEDKEEAFVLAPMSPTQEMLEAGLRSMRGVMATEETFLWIAYKAMIAARPK